MFKLANISKRYGANQALHPTGLTIGEGKTTVLIGPSGSGKSTLLRLMIGLISADTGRISFDDEIINTSNVYRFRQRAGYVIQDGGLFPHLTASENVTIMARYLGWDVTRLNERLTELTHLVKLTPSMLNQYPIELSGGQRQRVSLMRALMLDPELLLLDEPLGSLDPMIRYELQQDLKDIFQCLHKTVVLVTHDMGEAAYFGDDIVLMRDGRVVQRGTLHDLLHQPADAFVESFINAQRNPWQILEEQ
ncbi:MAG: ATP-binding cassette domain-containing protein [Gammaproteobacteria bacterium]